MAKAIWQKQGAPHVSGTLLKIPVDASAVRPARKWTGRFLLAVLPSWMIGLNKTILQEPYLQYSLAAKGIFVLGPNH